MTMITVRESEARGHANHEWLDTYHTFSFGGYHDPEHMGFRTLRVINEDRVKPGAGFPTHAHRDMEIITYVLDGALEHKDNMGNNSVIRSREVQRMSAGTGVTHSEYNHSQSEPVHLLQIWITPGCMGVEPSYEQKMYSDEEKRGKLRLIASEDGRNVSLTINQDADVYAGLIDSGQEIVHELKQGRNAWIQVTRGRPKLNNLALAEGDGASICNEATLRIVGNDRAEVLVFDLP